MPGFPVAPLCGFFVCISYALSELFRRLFLLSSCCCSCVGRTRTCGRAGFSVSAVWRSVVSLREGWWRPCRPGSTTCQSQDQGTEVSRQQMSSLRWMRNQDSGDQTWLDLQWGELLSELRYSNKEQGMGLAHALPPPPPTTTPVTPPAALLTVRSSGGKQTTVLWNLWSSSQGQPSDSP